MAVSDSINTQEKKFEENLIDQKFEENLIDQNWMNNKHLKGSFKPAEVDNSLL
jgi:hypothetical protein